MNKTVKTILEIVGILLAVAGIVCAVLAFLDKLPDWKKLFRRRPKEFDDYADVDDYEDYEDYCGI